MTVQIGVKVPETFQGNDTVFCAATPAGNAVHTTHWGAYSEMAGGYKAIEEWATEAGIQLTGPSWEVYGHWNDDPTKLRTDIYYLVGEA